MMDLLRKQRSMDLLQYKRSMDNTNLSHLPDEYEYDYQPVEPSVKDVIYHIIDSVIPVIVSIMGAAFFIFILTRKQLRNNPTCWLVFNVLVSVLIHGLVILPIKVTTKFPASWELGLGGCYIYLSLSYFNAIYTHSSVLLLMIDRFIYFCKQAKHPEIMTSTVVRIMIISLVAFQVLSCIMSLAISTPRVEEFSNVKSCKSFMSSFNGWLIHYILIVMMPACVNILFGLITFVCTLVMCYKFDEGNADEKSKKKQAVALNMLMVLFNAICCFSLIVFILLISTSSVKFTSDMFQWLLTLCDLYHALLPILIAVLIPEIRNEMSCCQNKEKGESIPLLKPMY